MLRFCRDILRTSLRNVWSNHFGFVAPKSSFSRIKILEESTWLFFNFTTVKSWFDHHSPNIKNDVLYAVCEGYPSPPSKKRVETAKNLFSRRQQKTFFPQQKIFSYQNSAMYVGTKLDSFHDYLPGIRRNCAHGAGITDRRRSVGIEAIRVPHCGHRGQTESETGNCRDKKPHSRKILHDNYKKIKGKK